MSFSHLADGRMKAADVAELTDFRLYAGAMEAGLAGARLSIVDTDLEGRKGLVLMDSKALRAYTVEQTTVPADDLSEEE